MDADGDGQADIISDGGALRVAIHLSSSLKDARSRTFDETDADRTFVGRGNNTFVLGPINDGARHYDMFGVNSAMTDRMELVFSGGYRGPDARYDALFPWDLDIVGESAGDIDGNGWSDYLCGNENYGSGGIATVLGGGAYIPRDSMPASSIRDIALDGHRAALTVWPQPAHDAVHIAWRGDLQRMPERYVVHDLLGRRVATGELAPQHGELVWNPTTSPPGAYVVALLDSHGATIATVRVVTF
jgi:hypothetical protein